MFSSAAVNIPLFRESANKANYARWCFLWGPYVRHSNVQRVTIISGMGERKYETNAERQAAYRERLHQREYDERRARAKVYAASLGDALGWDQDRVEEALVRVASHEDGLVAVELALQTFARRSR